MRYTVLIAGLAAIAVASPTPQVFDPADFENIEPPSAVTVPIGGGSETVPHDTAAAIQSAYVEVLADPSPDLDASLPAALNKREAKSASNVLVARGDCAVQTAGSGPQITPDTPEAFTGSFVLAQKAINAKTPVGFVQTFQNQQASVSGTWYLGFTTYSTYDPALAAADCKAKKDCKSFNLYYERDPSKDPGDGCKNPPSTNNIKAAFWGEPIGLSQATNKGETRTEFKVVIAGSNAYQLADCSTPLDGYNKEDLGSCSIQAPGTTCNAYLTVKTWNDGLNLPHRCRAACDAIKKQGNPCNYFVNYVQNKDGCYQFQACALYKRAFSSSLCTNTGYTSKGVTYTISQSTAYTNQGDDGVYTCPVGKSTPAYFA